MDNSETLFQLGFIILVVAFRYAFDQSRMRAAQQKLDLTIEEAPDVVTGEQVGPDYVVRWGVRQVDMALPPGFQEDDVYAAWSKVPVPVFVEVQATKVGRALRPSTLAEPQRSLVRGLADRDVLIEDDKVRLSWADDMSKLDEHQRKALLLFVLLRYAGTELIQQIRDLAHGPHRPYVLRQVLTHLHTLPHIETVAQVTASDTPEVRLAAALLLGRAEEALDLAARLDSSPVLCLRALDRFGATHPQGVGPLLQRLLLHPSERRAALGRIRALPLEQAVAVLEPVCQNLETEALPLLVELAPDVALPHIRAALSQAPSLEAQCGAARLLHPFDAEAAEAVFIGLLAATGVRAQALLALGQLGGARAVPPLLALAESGPAKLRAAAAATLAEVRARLANRPAGALALSERAGGHLALVGEVAARE